MKYTLGLLLLVLSVFVSCKSPQLISPFHPSIVPMGRVGADSDSSALEVYWSGSGVKFAFEGTGLSMVLKDENYQNYFNVIIDEDSISILRPDTIKRTYRLAEDLPAGKHEVELFKRTEWTRGTTAIYGIVPDKGTRLLAPQKQEMRMEFYGNSISCGYGVEDYSGNDSPDSIFTNNYLSYAALTARYFDADYTCISRSGIGLTVSWFNQIMQDIYDLKNPNDPDSKWDFQSHQKDVVVVNLFQNDSWIVQLKNHVEFKRRFGREAPSAEFIIQTYVDFISDLRSKYPDAEIICMLGNMDITKAGSPWIGYVEEALHVLNDSKAHMLVIPYKGTKGHPHIEEQALMAKQLIRLIESLQN